MPNWTREHDAHIARECEGLEILTCKQAYEQSGINNHSWTEQAKLKHGDYWVVGPDVEWMPLYSYTTDANARDRAAEAWRRQGADRQYFIFSPCVPVAHGNAYTGSATVYLPGSYGINVDGPNALLWALYRATKGKE